MATFLSTNQAQALIDAGFLRYLDAKIKDHDAHVTERITDTWRRTPGVTEEKARDMITLYTSGNDIYVGDIKDNPDGRKLLSLTPQILSELPRTYWSIYDEERAKPQREKGCMGESGNTKYLTPEGLQHVIEVAEKVHSTEEFMNQGRYGDAQESNMPSRWRINELIEAPGDITNGIIECTGSTKQR